jgi:putative ABC transport system ATP-binding protein
MFRLENVSKRYRRRASEVVALNRTSLEIGAGEYVAIIGPSGSGKTTLLSLLGGMLSPDGGRVWLGGDSLYELPLARRTQIRRERIGFVFQTFNLVPYLTALENVQVPLCLAGTAAQEQRERAVAVLKQFGLEDRLHHKPPEMSVGQQQRVALARTLVHRPPIVLADEPTGNLDPESREHVLDFLDDWHAQGNTVIMVTHDMSAASRAERLLTLRGGSICGLNAEQSRQAA